jgi:hypothetical protein
MVEKLLLRDSSLRSERLAIVQVLNHYFIRSTIHLTEIWSHLCRFELLPGVRLPYNRGKINKIKISGDI